MSPVLLGVTAAIYGWVAFDYYRVGQPGMCVAFVAYAAANVGFIWQYLRTTS